jgi:ABC-type branched-subunit amino acid transport system ATPase component
MNRGRVLAEGPPAEIRENRAVREIYLGEDTTA